MVIDSAFVCYIYIPWGNTLSLIPKSRSSVKVKNKGHGFLKKMAVLGAFVFHKHSLLEFAEDTSNVAQMIRFLFEKMLNIIGKKKIFCLLVFSPFYAPARKD